MNEKLTSIMISVMRLSGNITIGLDFKQESQGSVKTVSYCYMRDLSGSNNGLPLYDGSRC